MDTDFHGLFLGLSKVIFKLASEWVAQVIEKVGFVEESIVLAAFKFKKDLTFFIMFRGRIPDVFGNQTSRSSPFVDKPSLVDFVTASVISAYFSLF